MYGRCGGKKLVSTIWPNYVHEHNYYEHIIMNIICSHVMNVVYR